MCNLSGKRVAGCVIWRVNGSQQIYGCGVMRPGRVHSADLRGPCSRLLKTFKSSDLCIGLVGYLETIRAKGLGSKISSFECIWVSRKHKKLFFCLDDPRRSLMWVWGVAPVHKLLQWDNRRPAVKQCLNTYNQHLQKWCWDSFPRALASLSSDCSFLLLLGSACLPVEREELL